MKLKRKEQALPTQTIKITLDGSLASLAEAYVKYYEITYQEKIGVSELLTEMIKNFIAYDRDFTKWHRAQTPIQPLT